MEACWAGKQPTFTLTSPLCLCSHTVSYSVAPSFPLVSSFLLSSVTSLLPPAYLFLLPLSFFYFSFPSSSFLCPFPYLFPFSVEPFLPPSHPLRSLSLINLLLPVVALLPFPCPVNFTSLPFAFYLLLCCFLPLSPHLILHSLSSFLSLFVLLGLPLSGPKKKKANFHLITSLITVSHRHRHYSHNFSLLI